MIADLKKLYDVTSWVWLARAIAAIRCSVVFRRV